MFDDDRSGSGRPRASWARGRRGPRGRAARLAAAGTAALVLGPMALAARASAATIAATKGCYVNADPAQGAPMTIVGSGFVPGDPVDISGKGVFASTSASPTGTIAVTTQAPILSVITPASLKTTVTATDEGASGAVTASTVVRSANLAVATNHPTGVKNIHKDKVTFTLSGFTPGKNVYGFYIRNKVVAKSNFGKATGPCGMLSKKALLYPGGHPHFSRYTVTFESRNRYAKKANPHVTGKLLIGPTL